MIVDDKEISSRVNLFYKEIFEKYEKLTEEDIDNLRIYIESIFSNLRSTNYKKEEYRKQLNDYLYPNISLVGLTNIYSNNKYIQYSFLMKVNNKIENELNNNKQYIKR